MAETEAKVQNETVAAAPAPAAEGKSSLFGKIKVLLFVLGVIGVECAVASWYLPSAAETAALANAAMGVRPKTAAALPETKEEPENAASEQGEVDLGNYTVTAYQPVTSSTLHINFHLYGTVKTQDAKEFAKRMEENQHRLREQVIVTVRGANISDLSDAGLGLVKRTILDKTNRLLGKPYLQSIVFSEFSFIEQ